MTWIQLMDPNFYKSYLQVKCVVAHMNFKNMTEMGPCWGIICHANMTKSNLCFPQGQTC